MAAAGISHVQVGLDRSTIAGVEALAPVLAILDHRQLARGAVNPRTVPCRIAAHRSPPPSLGHPELVEGSLAPTLCRVPSWDARPNPENPVGDPRTATDRCHRDRAAGD
jgi:hypothetical protein